MVSEVKLLVVHSISNSITDSNKKKVFRLIKNKQKITKPVFH
jgi:hypothetical protein